MVSVDEGFTEMVTFAWFDRNRRYFIVTIGYLEEGKAVSRQRWCQVVADVNTNIQIVDLDIPQTVTADMYYATFSDIDKEGMIISSWRRSWALAVGTSVII